MAPGEAFTPQNLRAIRPGDGLSPKHYDGLIGRRVRARVAKGTPVSWDLLGD
jgi:N-acetylneuraminate synthase